LDEIIDIELREIRIFERNIISIDGCILENVTLFRPILPRFPSVNEELDVKPMIILLLFISSSRLHSPKNKNYKIERNQ